MPVQTSLFRTLLHLTTKLTYLMTAYYTPNDGFTANSASFYKNKVGYVATLHVAVSSQLIVYANIEITIRGTNLPIYEFAAKQAKK